MKEANLVSCSTTSTDVELIEGEVLEKIQRVPITQEFLADMIAQGKDHELPYDAYEMLYDSIKNLVHKITHSFKITVIGGYEIEDLENECYFKLSTVICQYDSSKGNKFSSWFYLVCQNHLKRIYSKNARRVGVLNTSPLDVETDDSSFNIVDIYNGVDSEVESIGYSMNEAIIDLRREYEHCEKSLNIINSIFEVNENGYSFPSKINLKDISRRHNLNYRKVQRFFANSIKPHFKECFMGV